MNTLEANAVIDPGASMYEFVRSHESGARTYANSIDVVIERGEGTAVFDTAGRRYLDFLMCAGTLATGHNHPAVLERIQRFLQSGHVMQVLDITTPAKHDFLTRLLECLPSPWASRARVQFCGPTGADAIEAALKLFKTATGRRSVIAFHGAYHGMTAGALALTGNLSAKRHVASLMPDVYFMPFPYAYRCPFGLGGKLTSQVSLAYIERALTDPESGIPHPAAMVVEVIQGEGGVIPANVDWLRGLRQITARLDIPLVIDEVQTGIGRTGTMFAFDAAGIEPDAIVISKAIGGGFPMSLVVYDKKYDVWQSGAHAGTFRGNQIAMAAGTACLDVIRDEQLVTAAQAKGEYLGGRLAELAAQYSIIGDVRGRGLMWGLEIVDPTARPDAIGSHPANREMALALKHRCLRNGLILENGGRYGAVLRMLPPLNVSLDEIDEAVTILAQALKEASDDPRHVPHGRRRSTEVKLLRL
ncbi:diaminobutyrate--2-oxoglutarate transaminase family protein [Pendulispora brunnea]|uniref:Diaminobutyrate--2-oxoglutarate transaminase family protein n=1 Tax=Pendulispora brunnea TaxID=2905690 RepID=A0ABZ2K2T4_9BACT